MTREKSVSLAFLVLGCLAACGGTVVFEEDGGRGDDGRDGDGGGGSSGFTSTAASTRPSSTNASTSTGADDDCVPDSSFLCDDGALCVPIGAQCDGVINCIDETDELGCGACPPSAFTCADGTCIDIVRVCDGDVDCSRAEDEAVSLCGSVVPCGEDTLPCFDGSCILESDVCDGQPECGSGEDEFPEICNGQICGTELSVGEPVAAYCLSRFCCDPIAVCLRDGVDPCLDCINGGGGPGCQEVLDCAVGFCDL